MLRAQMERRSATGHHSQAIRWLAGKLLAALRYGPNSRHQATLGRQRNRNGYVETREICRYFGNKYCGTNAL